MKAAIVGTGYWGSNHARVAAELVRTDDLDDALICDVDETRARSVASDHGLDYVTSHEELGEHGVDVAVVATPPKTHEPIASDLLEAGLDVLVEKPLADTPANARSLVELADRLDRTLGVGHIFRHHPALRELKSLLDADELGTVSHLRTARHAVEHSRAPGVLHDLAVHDVDIYRYLLDANPDTVYCRLDDHTGSGHAETASLVFTYGDTTGVVSESWKLPSAGKRRDVVVVGSELVAHVDYLEDTVVELYDVTVEDGPKRGHVEGSADPVAVVDVEGGEPLKNEVRSFLGAVETGSELRTTGDDGAWAVELLTLAERSHELNEVLEVGDGDRR